MNKEDILKECVKNIRQLHSKDSDINPKYNMYLYIKNNILNNDITDIIVRLREKFKDNKDLLLEIESEFIEKDNISKMSNKDKLLFYTGLSNKQYNINDINALANKFHRKFPEISKKEIKEIIMEDYKSKIK